MLTNKIMPLNILIMENEGGQEKYQMVKRAISLSRRRLLDVLEIYLKDDDRWEFVKKKIFQCLGNNGLDGLVDDVFGQKNNDKI